MERITKWNKLAFFLLVLFALFYPLICRFDNYMLHVGIIVSFAITMALSMWLIYTLGLISFAHAGFMGIGAYTSAILYTRLGWPLWIDFWLCGAIALVIAFIVGIPLMRTKAVYFFMASWALGEVITRVFVYFRGFFGGWDGIFNINPPSFLSSRVAYYYVVILFAVVVVLLINKINNSRTGMIYWAIHESEILAQHVGINVLKHKIICFCAGSVIAAMTGSLFAHYNTYINPHEFGIWTSEFALVHIIVGGLNTVVGPILGAGILTVVDELLRPTEYFRVIIFGVVIIVTVIFFPGGLESLVSKLRNFFQRSITRNNLNS